MPQTPTKPVTPSGTPAQHDPPPKGKLDLRLLPHALTPWTDTLNLSKLEGVDDEWLARVAVCNGLRVLDITNCNLVSGMGQRV
jgi:hypothetical protein